MDYLLRIYGKTNQTVIENAVGLKIDSADYISC